MACERCMAFVEARQGFLKWLWCLGIFSFEDVSQSRFGVKNFVCKQMLTEAKVQKMSKLTLPSFWKLGCVTMRIYGKTFQCNSAYDVAYKVFTQISKCAKYVCQAWCHVFLWEVILAS